MKTILLIAFILVSFRAETPVETAYKKSKIVFKAQPTFQKIAKPEPVLVLAPVAPRPVSPLLRSPAQVVISPTKPERLDHLVIINREIISPTGEWIASNISALPSNAYSPSMGKEIYSSAKFTFFEGKTEDSVAAAFNPSTQKFYPVSQVLMLKKINEDLRQELSGEGHKEYYYNSRLRLLSIQSTPQDVLSLYTEFKNRGLDVRIEVLKETPHAR